MAQAKYTQEFFDNAFFQSRYLNTRLFPEDVCKLSPGEAKSLKVELDRALKTLNEKIEEQKDSDDYNWLHRLSVKKEVVKAFLEKIKAYQAPSPAPLEAKYHLSFFRQLVAKRIGPLEADNLYEKARGLAQNQIKKEFNSQNA
jgi:hypothetical protein|tara:strand:+ start:988 stop:1416 length:429 start_codon:yes stop_codon:yes gene_type:complete